jgi:hypothetical protein
MSSTPAPAQQLGPYELTALVGRAARAKSGARDTGLNSEVAIGFLQAEFSDRFQREANIAALNHPNTLGGFHPGIVILDEPLQ